MLQFITAGESHGKYLTAIVRGLPSGLTVSEAIINDELKRRQRGYGRGGRMRIESDSIVITGGVIRGKTTGAPIGLMIQNQDVTIDVLPQLERPRPGHADCAGALKYDQDIRAILERSSARETAIRVAVGAVTKAFLRELAVDVFSYVTSVGGVSMKKITGSYADIKRRALQSNMNCADMQTEKQMITAIRAADAHGDTLGGTFEVVALGLIPGLGSHVHYTQKLDARLAGALMSVQAVKAVEFGLGTAYAAVRGSEAHDEIFYTVRHGYYRRTNNAGGIEGGMSNGSPVVARVTMKPIATLQKPLQSINMRTKKAQPASFERADVCAVPACSVVAEAVVSYELADAVLEKTGGDSIREVKRNWDGYKKQIGWKQGTGLK